MLIKWVIKGEFWFNRLTKRPGFYLQSSDKRSDRMQLVILLKGSGGLVGVLTDARGCAWLAVPCITMAPAMIAPATIFLLFIITSKIIVRK